MKIKLNVKIYKEVVIYKKSREPFWLDKLLCNAKSQLHAVAYMDDMESEKTLSKVIDIPYLSKIKDTLFISEKPFEDIEFTLRFSSSTIPEYWTHKLRMKDEDSYLKGIERFEKYGWTVEEKENANT